MIVTSYYKMLVLVLKDHKMAVAAPVKRRKKEGNEAVRDNTFTRKTEAFQNSIIIACCLTGHSCP